MANETLEFTLAVRGHQVNNVPAAAIVLALRSGEGCALTSVCGTSKRLCLVDEIGMYLTELESSVGGIYPLFFCEIPSDEPTCTPQRSESVNGSTIYTGVATADDPDGDGIEAGDNCPRVFNPIRPLDAGSQADTDGDGIGDACDPLLSANVPALSGGAPVLLTALLVASTLVLWRRLSHQVKDSR